MSTQVSNEIGLSYLGEGGRPVSRNHLPSQTQARKARWVLRSGRLRPLSVGLAAAALGSLLLTSITTAVASASTPPASTLSFTQQDFQPQALTDRAPALGFYYGDLYFAWKGKDTDKVFYSDVEASCLPSNGALPTSCWSPQTTVSGPWGSALTLDAPALEEYDGHLYAFWTGKTGNKIWYSASNGTSWSAQATVSGPWGAASTDQGPAVTFWAGDLYVAWDGLTTPAALSSPGLVGYSYFNGTTWAPMGLIAAGHPWVAQTVYAPALAPDPTATPPSGLTGGALVFAWTTTVDHVAYSECFLPPGTTHNLTCETPGYAPGLTNAAPALTSSDVGNFFYAAWKGKTAGRIWYSDFNGSSWAPQQVMPQALTNQGPALSLLSDTLYVAWKGKTHGNVGFEDADLAPPPP